MEVARGPVVFALLFGLAACVSVEPSHDLLVRVRTTPRTEAPVKGPPDPFADERDPEELKEAAAAKPEALTPEAVAEGTGIHASPAEMIVPTPPVPPPPPMPPGLGIPAMGFAFPASWGVRLVSTVAEAQPPRAILGLPDGSERVVVPGTMIPEAGVVVLAVGRDAVQVAQVRPEGDHTQVQAFVINALFPVRSPTP